MFRKRKLYKITYMYLTMHTTIVEAKDEMQALRKFCRSGRNFGDIISIVEYKISDTEKTFRDRRGEKRK